jgi:uncharacterized membrane protein YdjX (TVP38/TMEM64 family)
MNAGTDRPPDAAATSGAAGATEPSWRRVALLAAVIVLLLAIVYLSPLREYLGRAAEVKRHIQALGVLAPLAVTGGVALLVALGFSRLLLCVLAGMALGFWSGLLWAQLGTLMGNYLLFLAVRHGGRAWAERRLAKWPRLHDLVRNEGLAGVILARQLPVPGLVINLACGLLPVRHRDFLLGTAIGQLPEAVPCTLIGAGVLKASPARSAGLIGLGVALAVRWLRRRQRE